MPHDKSTIEEPLDKIVQHLEEEARMVLPGIQALFGFQLICVFNQRFTELSHGAQNFHFIALLCTMIAIGFVLTPAAYHRQAEPSQISPYFCALGSKLLTASMLPLLVATSLDLYVIATLIVKSNFYSAVIAALAGAGLFCAWFLFPQLKKRV